MVEETGAGFGATGDTAGELAAGSVAVVTLSGLCGCKSDIKSIIGGLAAKLQAADRQAASLLAVGGGRLWRPRSGA